MEKQIEEISNFINNKKKIIIFGLSYCNYSKQSIEYAIKNKLPYEYYEIDKYYNIFFNIIKKIDNDKSLNFREEHRTFPVLFYKKKFIGGYVDFIKYFN